MGFFVIFLVACVVVISTSLSIKSVFGKVSNLFKSKLTGYQLTKTPTLNKGKSFTPEETNKLRLRGLFPAGEPLSLELKIQVAMEELRKKTSPLEKYIHLHTIQDADETLYYGILMSQTTEVMPFVYTPTVGEACIQWNKIYR